VGSNERYVCQGFCLIYFGFLEKGCLTMINDDIMSVRRGLFAYEHHNGFEKEPTDHFFRPFSLFNVVNEVKPVQGQCNIHGEVLKLYPFISITQLLESN
jgi:hypothetical protein